MGCRRNRLRQETARNSCDQEDAYRSPMSASTMLPEKVLAETPQLARKAALHDKPPSKGAS
jgi:hypothetical protein